MWVAALCLKACGLTRFLMPARVSAIAVQINEKIL
jgi:hypothetical protein